MRAQVAGDPGDEAHATAFRGIAAEHRGDYDDARRLFTAASEMCGQSADRWHHLMTQYHLGVVSVGQGDDAQAVTRLEATLAAARELGDMLLPSWCLQRLALIAFDHGDAVRVAALLRQLRLLDATSSAMHHIRLGHLMTTAILATLLGEAEAAARLLGAAAVEFFDVAVALPNGGLTCAWNAPRGSGWESTPTGQPGPPAAAPPGRPLDEIDRLLAVAGETPAGRSPIPVPPGSRLASAKYCTSSWRVAPIRRSPTPCSSATAPPQPMSPISSPSSASKTAPPPSPMPSSMA